MALNWKKAVVGTAVVVGGGALCWVTAGAAAPAVGAWVGSTFLGWSGCAATSSGLALLGGGSLASGGLGMAGGTALISGVGAATGAAASGAVAKAVGDNL